MVLLCYRLDTALLSKCLGEALEVALQITLLLALDQMAIFQEEVTTVIFMLMLLLMLSTDLIFFAC